MQSLVAKKQKRMEEEEQEDKMKQRKKKNAEKEKNKKDAIKKQNMEEWQVDNPNSIMCMCWKVGGRACDVQTAICISAVIVGKLKQNHVGLLLVRRPWAMQRPKLRLQLAMFMKLRRVIK